MNEANPGLDPEKNLSTVRFGDVVRCGSHNPDQLIMITDVDRAHHHHSGVALVNPDEGVYGAPGTIPPGQILEVIDHISHDQATEMLVKSLGEAMRDCIVAHYESYRE